VQEERVLHDPSSLFKNNSVKKKESKKKKKKKEGEKRGKEKIGM